MRAGIHVGGKCVFFSNPASGDGDQCRAVEAEGSNGRCVGRSLTIMKPVVSNEMLLEAQSQERRAPAEAPALWRRAGRRMVKTFALCSALGSLSLPCSAAASRTDDTSYTISGRLRYVIKAALVTNLPAAEFTFRVSVSNDLWYIETVPLTNPGQISSFETGTDGTNTYSLTRFRKPASPPDAQSAIRTVNKPRNDSLSVITSGSAPMNGAGMNDVLWLAYASHKYLATLDGDRLPCIAILQTVPGPTGRTNTLKARWSLLSSFQPLPETIAFLNEGFGTKYDFQSGTQRLETNAHPFQAGYVFAEYKVTESFQIGNLRLPKAFEILRYAPASKADSTNDLEILGHLTAHAIEAKEGIEITTFLPKPTAATLVSDERFGVGKEGVAARYLVTNQTRWLGSNAVLTNVEVKRQSETAARREKQIRKAKFARPIFICLVLLSGLVMIAAAFTTKKPQHQLNSHNEKKHPIE
jgi:hypothetical protein